MAVIFDWVAFGPGPRHFSGGTGLRIGPVVFSLWGLSPELEGRLVIGLGALMIDAMAVYGWVRFAREFAAGKLSTPAPRAAAAPSEAGIPTGVRIDRPAVPAVVGLLIVALAVGAVLTLKKGFQPPPAPLGVPIAAAPAPRSDGELVSPIQDGDIAFLQSEAGKLFWRGNEHENRKEHDAALADFTEALRLDPKRAMVYNSRAAVYGILRRDAEAVADYDEAVRLAPDDPANYQARGLLLANMGKRDLARADCEKLKTLDSAQGEWLCGYITRR
jgi:tetratricopeptide (TPR) repeat protein